MTAQIQYCKLTGERVAAGFPSPATDYMEGELDLNKHLIPHPAATFFVRASGDSMVNCGIFPGDILIVDRSLEASDRQVIIAVLDGEFTVKTLVISPNTVSLSPANPAYPSIPVRDGMEFSIWGVVTYVIHPLIRAVATKGLQHRKYAPRSSTSGRKNNTAPFLCPDDNESS